MYILFLFVVILTGCSKDEIIEWEIDRQFHGYNSSSDDSLKALGVVNAVKKAYHMSDIKFVPKSDIISNNNTYKKGREYRGMIYSSTKEISTYVGEDVSFHTFMTAINNPKSRIYTDRINKPPYHGANCSSYYGTVCSGVVNYALGLSENYRSYDFVASSKFKKIESPTPDSVQIADILWQPGHVLLVTNISKLSNGDVSRIEVTESTGRGTRRYEKASSELNSFFQNGNKLLRYLEMENNLDYIPLTSFVAVGNEQLNPYQYNDLICPDKGDRSCYRTDEDIILNISNEDAQLEIYKGDELREVLAVASTTDVCLHGLEYGDYKARVSYDGVYSDFVSWKVIDTNVSIDSNTNRIYFSSANATPAYFEFCNIAGFRPERYDDIYTHVFTKEELQRGYIDVAPPTKTPDEKNRTYTYVKVHFKCDYGRIINAPLNWYNN